MFILYSIAKYVGMLDIKDKDFITAYKNYLQGKYDRISAEKFMEYEQLDDVDYILPGNVDIDYIMDLTEYYQTSQGKTHDIE